MLKNVAMLLDHSGHHDSRVLREAEILKAAGYHVTIFCLNHDAEASDFRINDILFVQCHIRKDMAIPFLSRLRKLLQASENQSHKQAGGQTNPASINSGKKQSAGPIKRALGWFFIFSKNRKAVADAVKAFEPQIIHAHDLFMLPAGAQLAQRLQCKLVYDSHEYERSRNDPLTPLEQKMRMRFERKFIKRADEIITVSDSIAAALARDYKIKKPAVFLNMPFPQDPDSNTLHPPLTRKQMNIPENVKVGIYTGAMTNGRGVDIAIKAMADLPELHLVLLGPVSEDRKTILLNEAVQYGVADRCHFLPPVAEENILSVLQLCDFSWIPIQKTCLSHDYSLPNKLFQSYEAGLPVFATPLSEIRSFIEYFKCGYVAEGFDARAQAKSLKKYLEHLAIQPFTHSLHPDYAAYEYQAMAERFLSIYKALESPDERAVLAPLPHSKISL
jgi:glycosyltransferase involved in cell wall biosynthesis